MKVMMMLADHAQTAGGKLFVSGGGLSSVAVGQPFALVLLIEVPWDRANERHEFRLRLIDEDGKAVGPLGAPPVEIGGQFEVGRPPGTKKGSNLPFNMSINFAPMPLQPEKSYVWSLSVDGETNPEWQVTFTATPPPQQFAMPEPP